MKEVRRVGDGEGRGLDKNTKREARGRWGKKEREERKEEIT